MNAPLLASHGLTIHDATSVSDGRVSYARLIQAGAAKLEEAATSHLADVEELFAARFSPAELATLAALLRRLPGSREECVAARAAGA